ncbi:MAG: hypothetical protein RR424_10745 [Oscillospiraceae bacterium]
MYLNDIPSAFELILENDAALADMFYALPVMEREKVANAGLYSAQEVSSYIESLIL